MFFTKNDFQPIILYTSSNSLIQTLSVVLEGDILKAISVFHTTKAKAIEAQLLPTFQKMSVYAAQRKKPLPSAIEDIEQFRRLIHTVKSAEETQIWLADLGITHQVQIIVSYDLNTALLMPWSVFVRYYDDFCYYGGFDVCICPMDEKWYLLYYHEDIFLFGRRKNSH